MNKKLKKEASTTIGAKGAHQTFDPYRAHRKGSKPWYMTKEASLKKIAESVLSLMKEAGESDPEGDYRKKNLDRSIQKLKAAGKYKDAIKKLRAAKASEEERQKKREEEQTKSKEEESKKQKRKDAWLAGNTGVKHPDDKATTDYGVYPGEEVSRSRVKHNKNSLLALKKKFLDLMNDPEKQAAEPRWDDIKKFIRKLYKGNEEYLYSPHALNPDAPDPVLSRYLSEKYKEWGNYEVGQLSNDLKDRIKQHMADMSYDKSPPGLPDTASLGAIHGQYPFPKQLLGDIVKHVSQLESPGVAQDREARIAARKARINKSDARHKNRDVRSVSKATHVPSPIRQQQLSGQVLEKDLESQFAKEEPEEYKKMKDSGVKINDVFNMALRKVAQGYLQNPGKIRSTIVSSLAEKHEVDANEIDNMVDIFIQNKRFVPDSPKKEQLWKEIKILFHPGTSRQAREKLENITGVPLYKDPVFKSAVTSAFRNYYTSQGHEMRTSSELLGSGIKTDALKAVLSQELSRHLPVGKDVNEYMKDIRVEKPQTYKALMKTALDRLHKVDPESWYEEVKDRFQASASRRAKEKSSKERQRVPKLPGSPEDVIKSLRKRIDTIQDPAVKEKLKKILKDRLASLGSNIEDMSYKEPEEINLSKDKIYPSREEREPLAFISRVLGVPEEELNQKSRDEIFDLLSQAKQKFKSAGKQFGLEKAIDRAKEKKLPKRIVRNPVLKVNPPKTLPQKQPEDFESLARKIKTMSSKDEEDPGSQQESMKPKKNKISITEMLFGPDAKEVDNCPKELPMEKATLADKQDFVPKPKKEKKKGKK